MGREVRRVPATWKHPKDEKGHYRPLFTGYESAATAFIAKLNADGLQEAIEWCGCPDKNDYMPDWPESERTHYMMYETTSEGTPISPAFATPEELAQWLTDTRASAFGSMTGTYDGWLRVAYGEFAPSAVYTPETGMISGVDGMNIIPEKVTV